MIYWLWIGSCVLFYTVPPMVLSLSLWGRRKLRKLFSFPLATGTGYALGNVSTVAFWDYRQAAVNSLTNPTQEQLLSATADGANRLFWLFLGWLPVAIYVLICWWILKIFRKKGWI